VSNPAGSRRCANQLSCRFVNARYNLAPPHCSQVSISIPKTRLSLCAQVIDWCFCNERELEWRFISRQNDNGNVLAQRFVYGHAISEYLTVEGYTLRFALEYEFQSLISGLNTALFNPRPEDITTMTALVAKEIVKTNFFEPPQ
jgi:hypothetical protein